jgi:hypothetical protein
MTYSAYSYDVKGFLTFFISLKEEGKGFMSLRLPKHDRDIKYTLKCANTANC